MNIKMQLCGLTILLLIMFFYNQKEMIGLYTEKIFKCALYVNIYCLSMDILSVIMIVNQDFIPKLLVIAVCKLYIASLVWSGYSALVYASTDAFRIFKTNKMVKIFGFVVLVDTIIIFLTPIYTYRDRDTVYTYGPSCIATYIGAVIIIIATLLIVILYGRLMNSKRRNAIITWMLIWLVAAFTQFLFSKLLVVGFASAIGIFILFLELENPESHIDKSTGLFNAMAFDDYLKQIYNEDQECCGIFISLEESRYYNVNMGEINDALYEIIEFLRKIPGAKIFKTDYREISIIFTDKDKMEEGYRLIEDRFKQEWNTGKDDMSLLILHPYFLKIPSKSVAENSDDMIMTLKYFKNHIMDNPEVHCTVVDENTIEKKKTKEDMISAIVSALDEDRVEVFYQPIYSTEEKKFVSAEALVRIRKDDGSLIPPGLFIPVAEETGLILKLGKRVFEKTCQFIKENDIQQYGVEYIEVNLSVVQCENDMLARVYMDIMNKYGVDPKYINLEITESASVVLKKTLLKNMDALIKYGVRFSLDDFGNGESNLNYILDMPVDIVKFDRDMTNAYFENTKAKHVLPAVTNMIKGLELKVVAEGVETEKQLKTLEGLGIDYIQGFYFSRPIKGKEFIEFVKTRNMNKQ